MYANLFDKNFMSQMNEKNPTIVIVNGANWLGARLVDTLIENNGNVIVVDDFNDINLPFIKKFSQNKRFVFIERDKIKSIKENFTKIKYFIHLKNDFNSRDDDISSKQFLFETKFTDEVLTLSLEKNSSYILISSLHLHKDFVLKKNFTRIGNAYTESDLQDYIERTVLEYQSKAGLNARIARLGNIYGPEMDLSKDPILKQILSDAFYEESIRIYGDGLEFMYYIYITDAIQGILRALFTPQASGQIYSLTNPDEISIQSIVNKILGFQPRAKKIKYLSSSNNINPLYEKAYIPDPNLNEIGWNPSISFDRGLASVYEYFRRDLSLESNPKDAFVPLNKDNIENSEENIKFDFDKTLNLSNSFYGTNHIEVEQFREFHKKLNSPDSPIYNSATKAIDYDPRKYLENIGKQERKKRKIFRGVLLFAFTIFLILFVLIPGLKLQFLGWGIKNKSDLLVQTISGNSFNTEIGNTKYQNSFDESLITIDWGINLANQNDLKSQYEIGLRGLDKSFEIYENMKSNNLNQAINSNSALSQEEYISLKSLRIEVDQAQKDISNLINLSLPSDLKNNISDINSWLVDLRERIDKRIVN